MLLTRTVEAVDHQQSAGLGGSGQTADGTACSRRGWARCASGALLRSSRRKRRLVPDQVRRGEEQRCLVSVVASAPKLVRLRAAGTCRDVGEVGRAGRGRSVAPNFARASSVRRAVRARSRIAASSPVGRACRNMRRPGAIVRRTAAPTWARREPHAPAVYERSPRHPAEEPIGPPSPRCRSCAWRALKRGRCGGSRA